MIHTIENEKLICAIESEGAEIRSLKDKATGEEYIWQIDPSIWGGSSPVLFPAIGKIKDEQVVFKEKTYLMPKHGIIRHNNHLSFEQNEITKCAFTLVSSEETFKQYPFKFSFTVAYALVANRLLMTYQVKNLDAVPMPFTCGGHTAYACPLGEDTKLSDYVIEFPSPVDLKADTLGASGLLSYYKREIQSNEGVLALSDTLFNKDALIFSNIAYDWVRLRRRNKKKGIVVRFKGFPHLALWSKPLADYVCVEPWLGLPDREDESTDLMLKSTYNTIEPGTEFSITIETEVE